jgi:hypothetical protein
MLGQQRGQDGSRPSPQLEQSGHSASSIQTTWQFYGNFAPKPVVSLRKEEANEA